MKKFIKRYGLTILTVILITAFNFWASFSGMQHLCNIEVFGLAEFVVCSGVAIMGSMFLIGLVETIFNGGIENDFKNI